MLAVSFARRDRAAAGAVLSDALGIAIVLGCALAAALYVAAPAALAAIAGEASRAVIAPALSYVRIRCAPAALAEGLGCLPASSASPCFARLHVVTSGAASDCQCAFCVSPPELSCIRSWSAAMSLLGSAMVHDTACGR